MVSWYDLVHEMIIWQYESCDRLNNEYSYEKNLSDGGITKLMVKHFSSRMHLYNESVQFISLSDVTVVN